MIRRVDVLLKLSGRLIASDSIASSEAQRTTEKLARILKKFILINHLPYEKSFFHSLERSESLTVN
jgi:hypothetical protein